MLEPGRREDKHSPLHRGLASLAAPGFGPVSAKTSVVPLQSHCHIWSHCTEGPTSCPYLDRRHTASLSCLPPTITSPGWDRYPLPPRMHKETCYQKEKDHKVHFLISIREPISPPGSPACSSPPSPSTQLLPLPSCSTPNWKSADRSLSQTGSCNITLALSAKESNTRKMLTEFNF